MPVYGFSNHGSDLEVEFIPHMVTVQCNNQETKAYVQYALTEMNLLKETDSFPGAFETFQFKKTSLRPSKDEAPEELDYSKTYVIIKDTVGDENKWSAKCETVCGKAFLTCWYLEYASMNFMLRYIANSLIYKVDGADALVIVITKWDDEWKICQFYLEFPNQQRRIVMGMGPSGCGKSTVSIPFLKINKHVHVMAIDGGGARSSSITWNLAKSTNPAGISNLYDLMFPKLTSNGQEKYLKNNLKKRNIKKRLFQILTATSTTQFKGAYSNLCTIYVADTVSNLLAGISEYTRLDKKWAALFIWQHKNCLDDECTQLRKCPYPQRLKCKGCDVSGSARSLSEGKIYTSKNYEQSMERSYQFMLNASTNAMIHNSGTENPSLYVTTDKTAETSVGKSHIYGEKRVHFQFLAIDKFPSSLAQCLSLIERNIAYPCKRLWSSTFKTQRGGESTRKAVKKTHDGTRTRSLSIRSRTLYPLSYKGKVCPGIEPGLLDSKSRVLNH